MSIITCKKAGRGTAEVKRTAALAKAQGLDAECAEMRRGKMGKEEERREVRKREGARSV